MYLDVKDEIEDYVDVWKYGENQNQGHIHVYFEKLRGCLA